MRILIVQRSLRPPGGGNSVAAWMIDALCRQHHVETVTLAPWPVAETNAFYGTAIPGAIIQHVAPAWTQTLGAVPDTALTRLRSSLVLRHARRLAPDFDLSMSADEFAAFAQPGIQYIHYPARLKPPPARVPVLVNAYYALCERIAGAPWNDAARNATLVNSRWTAAGLSALGEVKVMDVLYPPVIDPGDGLPWAERRNTFLCVGRFVSYKRIEVAIEIVARVRRSVMPDATLTVIGSAVDRKYARGLRSLAAGLEWVEILEDLSRQGLNRLIHQSRYGIQPMIGEHFGMATAEMTRGGCLVFAHDSGGAPEVLDDERSLLWSTVDDAVDRIAHVQADAVRSRLSDHARQFSTQAFTARVQSIVADYVSRRNSGSASNS